VSTQGAQKRFNSQVLADFSPLLLQAVMKQINPAEAIVRNFFIGFLILVDKILWFSLITTTRTGELCF